MLDTYLQLLASEQKVKEASSLALSSMSDDELFGVVFQKTAKRDMPHFTDQDRPEKVKSIYKALKREHPNMPAEVKARIAARKGKKSPQSRKPPETGGPAYKAPLHFTRKGETYKAKKASADLSSFVKESAQLLHASPMEKEALMPLLRATWRTAKNVARPLLKKAPAAAGGAAPAATAAATAPAAAAGKTGWQRSMQALKSYPAAVSKTWGKMTPGQKLTTGLAGASLVGGVSGGLASGFNKQGSVLFQAGDAAGRILAKHAAIELPLEELQESMQEAQEREDVPGRSRRAGILGGVGGGTLGALGGAGAGYGLTRALGKKSLLPAALLGSAGAAGGAFAGQRMGSEYGAQEAEADRVLSALRAARAAQMGYGAGLQRGYSYGMGQ